MELTIETSCQVAKRMQTSRDKSGDDEIVTCGIGVKGVRVQRDQMDELAGLIIGTSGPLFNELGLPQQRMSFLLPKRELLAKGTIEHRRESGRSISKLDLNTAAVGNLRFNLDTPDDAGPTAIMSFTLLWKAAGDEVEEVKHLLAHNCYMKITFRDPPTQQPLGLDNRATAQADQAAGDRAKLDRKRLAAGEKQRDIEDAPQSEADELFASAQDYVQNSGKGSISAVQRQFKIGYNRAARMIEMMEGLGIIGPLQADGTRAVLTIKKKKGSTLEEIEKEAKELARKHPRKEHKPAAHGKR